MPHISKSQLESLMMCPKLYEYERFGGIVPKDSLALTIGGSYHKVWQDFFRHKMGHVKQHELKWCQEYASKAVKAEVADRKAKGTLESYSESEYGETIDQVVKLTTAYYPFAQAIDPIAVERHYELSIPCSDWTVDGWIDLIYKSYVMSKGQPVLDEHGEPSWVAVVVDHKTASSSPYDPANTDRRLVWRAINEWSFEAIGYALAYRIMYGQHEDRFEYHYAVKTKEAKILVASVPPIDDAKISWYFDVAIEAIETIKRGHFPRNFTGWKHTPSQCPAWNQCHGIVESFGGVKTQLKVV